LEEWFIFVFHRVLSIDVLVWYEERTSSPKMEPWRDTRITSRDRSLNLGLSSDNTADRNVRRLRQKCPTRQYSQLRGRGLSDSGDGSEFMDKDSMRTIPRIIETSTCLQILRPFPLALGKVLWPLSSLLPYEQQHVYSFRHVYAPLPPLCIPQDEVQFVQHSTHPPW
jgi:hypothetical protein